MTNDWDEAPAEKTYGIPEIDPSPHAGIAGDGLGDEVYMIAIGVAIAAGVAIWVSAGWLVNWIILAGVAFFAWRVITVWPPARSAWLRLTARFVAASKLLWRFGVLAMKKKTPEVSSEMGHITTFMPQTMPLMSPIVIVLGVLALSFAWGGWGWFIHAPGLERKLKEAEAAGAVAVGANSDWETTIRQYREKLAEANAALQAQSEESQAGEIEAFRRGRAEGLRIKAGRQKQRSIEDALRDGADVADPDSFLRDIGIAADGEPPGGSAAPDGGAPGSDAPG